MHGINFISCLRSSPDSNPGSSGNCTRVDFVLRSGEFPRAWLERNGVDDLRQINQMANFALLEWPDNIDISDDDPKRYVDATRGRFKAPEWQTMHELHALPDDWQNMRYDEFLTRRRQLMADIIRRGFDTLRST